MWGAVCAVGASAWTAERARAAGVVSVGVATRLVSWHLVAFATRE